MKIFISWSGERSKAIAKALNDFLPKIIQAVKPFYSSEIEKGATWSNKIDEALAGTSFGVICLTPENLDSKWILFESGALFKTHDARVWTFLTGLKNQDVPPPLSKFQHTLAEKAETFAMIQAINSHLKDVGGEPVKDSLLQTIFNAFWDSFKEEINMAEKIPISVTEQSQKTNAVHREDDDILGEILEIVRDQQQQTKRFENRVLNLISNSGIDSSNNKKVNDWIRESFARAKAENNTNIIGIEFTVNVAPKEKQSYKKYLESLFNDQSVVKSASKISDYGNSFLVRIIYETSFDKKMFNEIKELISKQLGTEVIDFEPLLTSMFS